MQRYYVILPLFYTLATCYGDVYIRARLPLRRTKKWNVNSGLLINGRKVQQQMLPTTYKMQI
jgi:hypothetical protein